MENNILRKNIKIFFIYRFLSRFYMYLPILAIVLYKFNLSFILISIVIAAHGLSLMIFKIPLGYLTKQNSMPNKTIVIIGEILKSLGILGLGFSNGIYSLLIIAQVISGIGFALTSSTESNLLFTAMKMENAENEYRSIEARSQGYSFLAVLISGIIGSVLAAKNITLPLLLTAPFSLISAITMLLFHEQRVAAEKTEYAKQEEAGSNIGRIVNYLFFYAINRATILTVFVFVLPIFLLLSFQINLVYFGAILSLFSLTAFVIANNFEKISSYFNKSQLWIITPLSLLIALALLLLKSKILLLAVPVMLGISASLIRPLTMGRVFFLVKENRNQVVSLGEQMFGLLNAIFLILMGYSFKFFPFSSAIYALIIVLLIGNAIMLISMKMLENTQITEQTAKSK